ncbi:CoA-disulfide reductase [Saccharolobus shibatae B12]|uniref:CoA-disulfide reductase n=1 Tax=Saccharolobus shibatae (strain ATCC 51178 / DSM 5389 / JCM 8931 / NBRC 15437 / B12) TaxID=523848 RepID=A0A8F5BMV5_SACSH|nr:CoA-disulfide reductase [Saccharolobus shibatae]QXJ28220.1 CoA-disulfide reductase [Saccharolobus shibatae B12]
MERLIIIGGGAAGMTAASWARRHKPNIDITVFESTKMVSHAPCGIPYFTEGLFDDENLFMTYTPEYFVEKRKINVKINSKVEEVDLRSRTITVRENQENKKYEFDYLLLSTGAKPKKLNAEGDRIFYVHHPADASYIRQKLWSFDRIAIIGGGILGIEMTEALRARGKKLVLIHRGKYLLNKMLDEDMGKIITDKVGSEIELKLNESLISVTEKGRLIVTDKGKYEVDATVVAIGVEPNVDLVKDQLKIGETGAIWADNHMRTSIENVYAAGDSTESINIITKQPDWVPFAPVANKMGFVAGNNIGGKDVTFPGVIGTMITKFEEYVIAKTGITENEAKRHNIKTVSATVHHKTRARYYPGSKDIIVKLIAEANTMRIIGAQIIGEEEVLGRLNMMAAVIQKGFTAEELFFVETGYVPPVNRVWDAVTLAARKLYTGISGE